MKSRFARQEPSSEGHEQDMEKNLQHTNQTAARYLRKSHNGGDGVASRSFRGQRDDLQATTDGRIQLATQRADIEAQPNAQVGDQVMAVLDEERDG
jgi:hypothetical protein